VTKPMLVSKAFSYLVQPSKSHSVFEPEVEVHAGCESHGVIDGG
jgi:hypothetical protein